MKRSRDPNEQNRIRIFSQTSDVMLKTICENAEITQQALQLILTGKTNDIYLSTALKLKRATGLNPHEYLVMPGFQYRAILELL